MGKRIRRPVALFLTLAMCLGMVNLTALAGDTEGHEHNTDGWVCTQAEVTKTLACEEEEHQHTEECYAPGKPELTCEETEHAHTDECLDEEGNLICGLDEHGHGEECYAPGEDVLACEKAEHTHGDDCYTVTEGEWTCVNAVQEFLDAVKAIPADIDAKNAEKAGELVNAAFDAYEVLVDAGLDEYDGVADALAKVEAAFVAIDEALDMESSSYASGTWYDGAPLLGFGAAIGFDPRDTTEFPKSDNTQISVIPWDFHNEKHAKDYYYYYDYRIGEKRTDPAPDPVQSSYFEKTYNWIDLNYYDPIEVSKSAPIGGAARFGWRHGVSNFNDPAGGLVPTIPSVYLYRLEEVTGVEYIAGGRDAIEFHASTEPQLESSGGPAYQPTGPYARIDVPIAENAPKGATIQVRFRMAMGYDMEWQPSEGTYNWYVQDFILNFTVGEGDTTEPDIPEADVTKYHDLYIPAGGYSTEMSFVEYYYDYWYGMLNCILSNNSFVQGDESVAEITDSKLSANPGSSKKIYNDVTIRSAENAQAGDTTKLYVTYTATSPFGANDGQETCLDVITVHIIRPREVQLDIDEKETVKTLGKSADGQLSTNGTVFRFNEGSTSIVKGQNDKSTQTMTLTGIGKGTAEIERQYHYYRNNNSTGYADYLTTYVDVVNVTVGDPQTDDPTTIDGLDIKKEGPASAQQGEEFDYTLTVTNSSSVAKTVTVTDGLPNGTTFVKCDPAVDGNTVKLESDGFTVTWTPTVAAGGTASLKITVKMNADANVGRVVNNVAELKSGDNTTKRSNSVETKITAGGGENPGTNPKLEKLEKVRLTEAPADVTLDLKGKTVNYNQNVVFVGDNASAVTLLYKITVTGTEGAKYKVTDNGATHVGGDPLEGTIAEGKTQAVIYVTKDFTKANINADGKLVNNATLESNGTTENPTDGPEGDNGKGSGSADAEKKHTVTINFKTDDNKPLKDSDKYEVEEGGNFNYGGVEQPQARKARANSDVTAVVIPRRLGTNNEYVLDMTASADGLAKLAAAKNITADVVADIIYSLDEKGTIGIDAEGKATDTFDNIPDKYQVKVTFKVKNGSWNEDTNKDNVIAEYVEKYKTTDGEQVMDVDGTATLADVTIPTAGNKPDTGYKAGSWNTVPTDTTTVTTDTTFTYTYVNVYTVTYTWTGLPTEGMLPLRPANRSYAAGEEVTVDTSYAKDREITVNGDTYTFSGWTIPETIEVTDGKFSMPAGNVAITGTWTKTAVPPTPMEIKAKYLVQRLTVENDVEKVLSSELRGPENIGTKVAITDIDKEYTGYTFDADNSKNVLDGTLSKTEAVILKLYFTKNEIPSVEHTVTVDPNNGENKTTEKVKDGEKFTVPAAPTTVPENKEFDGWKDSDGKDYKPGDEIEIKGDLTLTAQWKDKTSEPVNNHTVTFQPNNGENTFTQTVADGGTATRPADPSRENYIFNGWYLNGTAYDFATPVIGDITLTAQWSRNSTGGGDSTTYYTLTINYVDGEGNAVATRYSRSHASGYDYSVTSPTVEGMTPDQTVVSGRLTRSTTVTVTYSPEEEIDEPDTPLVETPETEKPVETPEAEKPVETPEPAPAVDPVPEEENSSEENLDEPDVPLTGLPEEESEEELNDGDVPLVSAPQTGDSLWTMVWVLLALVSAAGIVFLAVVGRKKGKRER